MEETKSRTWPPPLQPMHAPQSSHKGLQWAGIPGSTGCPGHRNDWSLAGGSRPQRCRWHWACRWWFRTCGTRRWSSSRGSLCWWVSPGRWEQLSGPGAEEHWSQCRCTHLVKIQCIHLVKMLWSPKWTKVVFDMNRRKQETYFRKHINTWRKWCQLLRKKTTVEVHTNSLQMFVCMQAHLWVDTT